MQIGHPGNRELRERSLAVFRCPSDPSPRRFMLHQPGSGGGPGGPPMFEVARANYSGVFGTGVIETAPASGNGVFFQNSQVRFAQILDGQSNTLLIGERASRLDSLPGEGSATWVGAVPGAHRSRARIVGRAGRVPNDVLGDFADFGSYHPFGANFVMADASVRMISDEIDLGVYHALATRAGRE